MPERRQLGVRELDEDLLVLGAVEIDLGHARHLQEPLAHAFGGLLQLRVIGAVAGHHVENGVDVGEFVVDDGAEQTRRQLRLHVDELLAQQIKQVGHLLRRRRIPEGDLHRGEGRLRIGLHLFEIGQFLQLLLDGIGDLGLHFGSGRARPDRRDVHHLDREERILGAAEPLIGEEAGGAERDDQEQDQRGMADRPGRKIEMLHRASPLPKPCWTSGAATTTVRPLSHGERAGVRGYGLSIKRNPSPGAARRPLPMGEVKGRPRTSFDRIAPSSIRTTVTRRP